MMLDLKKFGNLNVSKPKSKKKKNKKNSKNEKNQKLEYRVKGSEVNPEEEKEVEEENNEQDEDPIGD